MKSKLTKAKEVSEATKKKVLARQENRSVTGYYLTQVNYHHFIGRGESGIGYEWNIIALTPEEHQQYHDGGKVDRYTHEEFTTIMRNHLVIRYPRWSEAKCKYHKGYEEKDYGVI